MTAFIPPGLNAEVSGEMLTGTYTYSLDMLVSCVSMLRLWLIAKLYLYINIWLKPRAYVVGNWYHYRMNLHFAIRADLKYRAVFVLLGILVFSVLYFGYILREVERPY
jgi:hypothetical protein